MKTYSIYTILISALVMTSCNKEMTKGLEDVSVSVTPDANVTVDGLTVTVNRGEPVVFNINGEPDFVTFYSGETGHQYTYKDRYETQVEDILSSKLKFNIYQEGASYSDERYNNTIDVFYTFTDAALGQEGFPGLSKTDFNADSTLVADFYKNGKWIPVRDHTDYDNLALNVVEALKVELDVKNMIGKNLVVAVAYNADERKNPSTAGASATNQPKYYFDSMCIENVLRNNSVTTQYAGNFMFTALNFNHNYLYEKSIKNEETDEKGNDWTSVSTYLPENLAYGTVTANVPGLWNMSSVANGGFFIQGTGSTYEWKTAWLVSDPINILACDPDKGENVKNLSQDLPTYTYTYNNVGTYKATFVFNNVNYKHDANKIINVVINVK